MSAPRFRALAFAHPDFDGAGATTGLRVTPTGRLATVTADASVRQAILLLLSTRPGERVNRPEYGCHLFRLVFEPADDTTAGLAIHYVARAIEQWEPRVTVLSLDAGTLPDDAARLEVVLRYRVKATQLTDELSISIPVQSGVPA